MERTFYFDGIHKYNNKGFLFIIHKRRKGKGGQKKGGEGGRQVQLD